MLKPRTLCGVINRMLNFYDIQGGHHYAIVVVAAGMGLRSEVQRLCQLLANAGIHGDELVVEHVATDQSRDVLMNLIISHPGARDHPIHVILVVLGRHDLVKGIVQELVDGAGLLRVGHVEGIEGDVLEFPWLGLELQPRLQCPVDTFTDSRCVFRTLVQHVVWLFFDHKRCFLFERMAGLPIQILIIQ